MLMLPNFHEALRADEEMTVSAVQSMISKIAPITVKSTINDRAQRLMNLINTTVGPCASKDYPFNIPKLERQALKYLNL